MYDRIKRTRYARSDKKRHYRVFFAAPANFDLVAYLNNLKRTTSFSTQEGKGTHVQTITMCIRPSLLRDLLEGVPEEVVVAYEPIKGP